jgi:hypothetical protein
MVFGFIMNWSGSAEDIQYLVDGFVVNKLAGKPGHG